MNEAQEFIFNKQANGLIDGKQADGMNTTIKQSVFMNFKLPLDLAKLQVQAAIKKVQVLIPESLADLSK